MSTSALIMMIVSMLVIWGGLAAAIINLQRGGAVHREGVHRDL